MITANEAHKLATKSTAKAYESKIFKTAIQHLEADIARAAAQGKNEISFNAGYFDLPKFSSLEKDEYATDADRAAIKQFMEEHGFTFFYYSMGSLHHTWFTCKW